jgi:hypothetical protein
MSNINGYKEPKFKIYDASGALISTIELPLTGAKGLVESYEVKKIRHELVDYSTIQKLKGYIIHFTLYYDSFIEADTLLKIKQILDYSVNGYNIELIPRKDYAWRKFDVYLSSDSFDLGLLGGYSNSKGHRLPVLVFTTKYLQTEMPWSQEGGDTYAGTSLLSPIEGQMI